MKCLRCKSNIEENGRYCGACGFDVKQSLPPRNQVLGSAFWVVFLVFLLIGYCVLVIKTSTLYTLKSLITLFIVAYFLILSFKGLFYPVWIYDDLGIVDQSLIFFANRSIRWEEIEKISYWKFSLNPRFLIRASGRRFEIPVFQIRHSSKVISDIVSYAIKHNPQVVIDDDTLKKVGRAY